jgi:hypothetical protein
MIPPMLEKQINSILFLDFDLEVYLKRVLTPLSFHLAISTILTQKFTFSLCYIFDVSCVLLHHLTFKVTALPDCLVQN